MEISNVTVYAVAEIGFIVLLALFFWIAALRKANKKQALLIGELRVAADSTEHPVAQNLPSSSNHSGQHHKPETSGSNSIKVLKLQLKKIKKELLSNKQQLANMQQYKDLYFKLEALLNPPNNDDEYSDAARVDLLEKTLTEQEHIIDDMKAQLDTPPGEKTDQYIEQLERTIKQLERSNSTLRVEIEQQERDLVTAEQKNEDIQQYRNRALALQTNEKRLNTELISLKTELYSATEAIEKNTEKLSQYNRLKETLREKEQEIKHLKIECDTLGTQYHDLAIKSLDNVADNLAPEKKDEVDILRSTLKETLQELEKKREECEALEQSYLEMDMHGEMEEKAEQLESSLADRTALEKTAGWLSSRAFEIKGSTDNEFKQLKYVLEDKSDSLSQSKDEQEEIEEKIFNLSNEETIKPDRQMERLKKQYNNLKQKYKRLKINNEKLKDKEMAFVNLQEEHNQLEKRYLALAQEAISR